MKKKLALVLTAITLSMCLLVGCGESSDIAESTETVTEAPEATPEVTAEATEAPHEHTYAEAITLEATCTTNGEATFTCECGDTYTEVIPATGHVFENYVYNEDATYEADGTETAKCNNCDVTDTRTAEGSMLTYTYTDMDATKYAKSTVNVRNLPNTDGEKLGGLSTNDEVKVTGQCNETGWYRIEFDGNVAYVSDSYLVDNKVETQTAASTQSSGSTVQSSSTSEFPYQLWTMYDNGSIAWFYMTQDHNYGDNYWNAYNACHDYNRARYTVVDGQCPEFDAAVAAVTGGTNSVYPTSYYVNGQRVYQYFGF